MEPTTPSGQTGPDSTRPAPNPASASHEPRIATPVMDVVPPVAPSPQPSAAPQPPVTPAPTQPARATPLPQPVHPAPDTVKAAPGDNPDDLLASELQQPIDLPAQPTLPAQPSNPNTKPIVITVIVIVILIILAVFAYLKSK